MPAGLGRRVPLHVGIIPDGNRRWARARGVPLHKAYERGYDVMVSSLVLLADAGVKYATLYVMSRENCVKRAESERQIIFSLLRRSLEELSKGKTLAGYSPELRVVGDLSMIPADIRETISSLEGHRSDLKIVLGICYSVSWEHEFIRKGLTPPSLELPPIDLVIRTGGMRRISGFFPLLLEYSELYFTNVLWPDFSKEELESALEWFRIQKRNFGE